MRSFLASPYYCDFSLAKDREAIDTVKDTLVDYRSYCYANVPQFSSALTNAMEQGNIAIQACETLLTSDDFSDLTTLASEIASLNTLVGAL
jgi:hypothetical protein